MIRNVTTPQFYSAYSHNNKNAIKINNIQASRNINFKSIKNPVKNISLTTSCFTLIGAISRFLHSDKNQTDFNKYFEEISNIPADIYTPEGLVHNPKVNIYINFLDNLDKKQKRQFVKVFCEKTGYPDLKEVQKKMDNEIIRALEESLKNTDIKPLFVGYDSNCSLGKGYALPGSDCDGLFIVVDKNPDPTTVNRATVGNRINQRILESQGSHYPELFTIDELIPYIEISDTIFEQISTPQKIRTYEKNLLRNDQDYMKAGTFNLDIASKITDGRTKNMLYLTAMFVEEYRAGHILINNLDETAKAKIENSAMYKYSNVIRQEGFKNNIKPKWNNRIKICSEFDSKSDSEKFEICSEILKSSMGIKKEKTSDFYEEFEMGNILEFIDALTTFRKDLKN